MKNGVLALLCLFIGCNSVNAQRIGLTSIVLNQYGADNSRSVHDTVVPWGSNIITPRLYSSQNGGYIIGVNGFADRQMLQMFKDNKELYVYGALFWFGAKHYNSGNTSSAVTFKLFALDSNNLSNAQGINKQGPGTLLSQISLPLSSLVADTAIASGLNYIEFPQAVHIDTAAGYAIGFDVTSLSPGDTVGLISSSDGDGEQKELSIEQWADG